MHLLLSNKPRNFTLQIHTLQVKFWLDVSYGAFVKERKGYQQKKSTSISAPLKRIKIGYDTECF